MGEEEAGRVRRALSEFTSRLLGKGLRVNSVILIGSRARGDWLKESDVDILVISDDFTGLKFYEREELISKEWDYLLPLEPWCYTRSEMEEAITSRPRIDVIDALEYGVVVYDDGFWDEVRKKYRERPYRRSNIGFIQYELRPSQRD